jgi:hypothetical protein
MKGFNKGFNQELQRAQQAQQAAEEQRRLAEQQQQKILEQQKNLDKQNKEKKDAGQGTFDYIVRTGQFTLNNQPIGVGFSGVGAARNNPALFNQLKTGPIPAGTWRVSARRDDPKTGEPIIDLQLFTGAHVKGRMPNGENFTIHPENSPNAGESGIAAPRNVRDQLQVGNLIRVDTR